MSVEMDDLYAQIRAGMALAREASDAWYEESYRIGIITDQSESAREMKARYEDYKVLLQQAELLRQAELRE